MHIMAVYQSLKAYNNKKHGIWITKKWFFPLRKSKQQIQWLNDHLIKNYNPWKVHVPNKTLERSFLYQSYDNFFVWLLWTRNWALFINTRYLTDCHVHKCLSFFFDLEIFSEYSHPMWVFSPLFQMMYICVKGKLN